MKSNMPLDKAKKVLKAYNDNNFNASKALQEAGYKESTATKQSKPVINSAIRKVATAELQELVESSNPMAKLLGVVGISKDEVMSEYLKIIFQDRDFSNKLKALMPLLATQGIKWDEEKTIANPTLNLTVKANDMALVSPVIAKEVGGTSVSLPVAGKEEGSPLSENAENTLSIGNGTPVPMTSDEKVNTLPITVDSIEGIEPGPELSPEITEVAPDKIINVTTFPEKESNG